WYATIEGIRSSRSEDDEMYAPRVSPPFQYHRRRRAGAFASCQVSMSEYPARLKARCDWPRMMWRTWTIQSGMRFCEYRNALRSGSSSFAPACSEEAAVRCAGSRDDT